MVYFKISKATISRRIGEGNERKSVDIPVATLREVFGILSKFHSQETKKLDRNCQISILIVSGKSPTEVLINQKGSLVEFYFSGYENTCTCEGWEKIEYIAKQLIP